MATLVVGGSGFIGSEAVNILAKNEVKSISFDKVPMKNNSEKTRWVGGDVLDLPSIGQVLSEYQVDTVLHFVGLPVVETCEKNPDLSFLLNVVSVQNVLEAMRLNDVKKIVFASTAAVYGVMQNEPIRESDPAHPNTMYGFHKITAEQIIKSYSHSYGLNYVIFRLFNVYGADPNLGKEVISIFIRKALKGEPLLIKGSQKFRDFIHVNDVAWAFLKACSQNGVRNTLNLGSGSKTSLGELGKIVQEYFPEVELKEEPAPDDGTGLQADISLARSMLGFEPYPSEKGIRAHVSRFSKNNQCKIGEL
jgi:UDP-glucose 4-epimerase